MAANNDSMPSPSRIIELEVPGGQGLIYFQTGIRYAHQKLLDTAEFMAASQNALLVAYVNEAIVTMMSILELTEEVKIQEIQDYQASLVTPCPPDSIPNEGFGSSDL